MLVILTTITIVSGYGTARHLFIRFSPSWFLLREIHLWFNWLFISTLIFHVFFIEVFIRFKWMSLLRNIWERKAVPFLLLKLIQKITGYALLITSLLVIMSGLNWYVLSVGGFIPFYRHIRFDIYLIPILVIHVGLGVKMALIRRRTKSPLVNIIILAITLFLLILVVSVDLNMLRISKF